MIVVDDGTDDGHHGNAAMLSLDGTTTLKGLGLSLEPAKGIVNAKGLSDTKLKLRDGKIGGDAAGLGGGEGGGRAGEKGSNGELHLDLLLFLRGKSGHGEAREEDGERAAATKPRTGRSP